MGLHAVAALAPPFRLGVPRGRHYDGQESRARALLGMPQSAEACQAVGFGLTARDIGGARLIRELRSVDVTELRRRGVAPVAVFDFDNTLMRGDVLDVFLEMALFERALDPAARPALARVMRSLGMGEVAPADDAHALLRRCLDGMRAGRLESSAVWQVALAACTGMHFAKAQAMARRLYLSGFGSQPPYRQRAFAESAALVGTVRSRGIEPYIVTAGAAFLARAGAAYLGVAPERVLGAELDVDRNGRFTGRAPDMGLIGKDNVIKDAIGHPPLFVFGDSLRTDTPMMRLALVQSFMVNPSAELVSAMRAEGRTFATLRM